MFVPMENWGHWVCFSVCILMQLLSVFSFFCWGFGVAVSCCVLQSCCLYAECRFACDSGGWTQGLVLLVRETLAVLCAVDVRSVKIPRQLKKRVECHQREDLAGAALCLSCLSVSAVCLSCLSLSQLSVSVSAVCLCLSCVCLSCLSLSQLSVSSDFPRKSRPLFPKSPTWCSKEDRMQKRKWMKTRNGDTVVTTQW